MIHPGPGVKVFVATKPVDFRKGHDGLAALVQNHLRQKPFDGAVYVFRAKRAGRLKLIFWDGSGLVMSYKRLEQRVADFKRALFGAKSEKSDPDQYQLAFEDIETAMANFSSPNDGSAMPAAFVSSA